MVNITEIFVVSLDDYLDQMFSKPNGKFWLSGALFEMTGLKVYLRINGPFEKCDKSSKIVNFIFTITYVVWYKLVTNIKTLTLVDPSEFDKLFLDMNQYAGWCDKDFQHKYFHVDIDIKEAKVHHVS